MLGSPKYDYEDRVKFKMDIGNGETEFEGYVYIIDAFGTFEQNEEVSYDIMVDDLGLFKHIRESWLYE